MDSTENQGVTQDTVGFTGWLGLSYQEQCERAKMAAVGEVWRNNKTGKLVTIRANTWRGIELLHSTGRVTTKQHHYFAGDYIPNEKVSRRSEIERGQHGEQMNGH